MPASSKPWSLWRRREILCRRCKQVNLRYPEAWWWAEWMNSYFCDVCLANLQTGERDVFSQVTGAITLIGLYALHVFVGVALGLGAALAVVLWTGEMERLGWWAFPLIIIGGIGGLFSAERAHRRGELIAKRRGR